MPRAPTFAVIETTPTAALRARDGLRIRERGMGPFEIVCAGGRMALCRIDEAEHSRQMT